MTRTIGYKDVITRKPHVCCGCGRTLPTKTAMSVVVTEDCGEIESSYWCKVCERFSAQVDMSDDDTITLGEFRHNEPDVWETIRAEVEGETT